MAEKPVRMAEGVYMLTIPFPPGWSPPDAMAATLCYLVRQRSGWLMVDCGFGHETSFDSLCGQLDGLGIPMGDIRYLFITHYHPDHFGMAGRVMAASGATLIMHRRDWDLVQLAMQALNGQAEDELRGWTRLLGVQSSEMDSYRQVMDFGARLFPTGIEPGLVIEGDDESIGDMGRLRAILTPGHSPGHICLYDQDRGLLFSGDHVLVEITSHIAPGMGGEDQLGEYLKALERVRGLDVKLVLPAHEEPFTHLSRRVDEILHHHQVRLQQVLVAVGGRPVTVREAAAKVEWIGVGAWDHMNGTDRLLAILETMAHLRLLQQRGVVTSTESDGMWLFRAS